MSLEYDWLVKTIGKETIQTDSGLYNLGQYLCWHPDEQTATLDGKFTAEELEAIATWMKKYKI